MEKILTNKERSELIYWHKKERDRRVCDRIKAVLLYDKGYSYTNIAEILLLDDETIRRHVDDYVTQKKLKPENGGSESQLTQAESRSLVEHLKEITYLYVKDICAYVKATYQKSYTVSGMTKWLHSQDFCYKKSSGVPAKADKEKQAEFIEFYGKLKKKARKKQEPIYFADSVHPQHQTELTHGWIFKGERKEIATTPYQKRLNFIGGICLQGQRFTYHQADRVNAEAIADFLWKLRQANPGPVKIHVIWDNAGYHRDKSVRKWAKALSIVLHYLPPYSPNLNPAERLWKLLHESVRYNRYYEKFSEFEKATKDFFKTLGRKKTLLKNRVTDNFKIMHSPILAS